MPVVFQYDLSQEFLLITFDEEISDRDVARAYHRAQLCASKFSIKRGILDGLKVTSFAVTADFVKSLAHRPPMLPRESDRCIVVGQDFLYGMARMYQMLGGSSRDRLHVVRTLKEAYEHLRIVPPSSFELIAD